MTEPTSKRPRSTKSTANKKTPSNSDTTKDLTKPKQTVKGTRATNRTKNTSSTTKNTANSKTLAKQEEAVTTTQNLAISAIALPQSQPRRYFDSSKLEQLAQSIKTHGILEPLIVRPLQDKQEQSYELVAGERRYRAAKIAEISEVPVSIRELSDEQALVITLMENLQREDLNPVEETEGIITLLTIKLQQTSEEVISLLHRMDNEQKNKVTNNVIGKEQTQQIEDLFTSLGQHWQSFVNNRLPLLRLPEDILDVLRQGQIEYTKARAIALVKDEAQRKVLMEAAIAQNWSLTQIKDEIASLSSNNESIPSDSPNTQIKAFTRRLSQSKLWNKDPKKWKQVQTWLKKIEVLLEEDSKNEVTE
jgi:ParB family chromosome partitioning protein